MLSRPPGRPEWRCTCRASLLGDHYIVEVNMSGKSPGRSLHNEGANGGQVFWENTTEERGTWQVGLHGDYHNFFVL